MAQSPILIPVEMEVSRWRVFPGDGLVQVWGYVGDYEVSICLPVEDERVPRLGRRDQPGSDRAEHDE